MLLIKHQHAKMLRSKLTSRQRFDFAGPPWIKSVLSRNTARFERSPPLKIVFLDVKNETASITSLTLLKLENQENCVTFNLEYADCRTLF